MCGCELGREGAAEAHRGGGVAVREVRPPVHVVHSVRDGRDAVRAVADAPGEAERSAKSPDGSAYCTVASSDEKSEPTLSVPEEDPDEKSELPSASSPTYQTDETPSVPSQMHPGKRTDQRNRLTDLPTCLL